jgi:hypothetical protein
VVELMIELYRDNLLDDINLDIAVNKKWITEEEKTEIVASKGA